MLLTAALVAYSSAKLLEKSIDEEDGISKNNWKRRLLKEVKKIERIPPVSQAIRCYSDTTNPTVDPAYSTGVPFPGAKEISQSLSSSSMTSECVDTNVSYDTTSSFRQDVRQEWIDAVFGTGFPHSTISSDPSTKLTNTIRQGVGLARIPSYTAYNASIPAHVEGEKLGITLSRIALGLYVRSVRKGSEAWCAGVKPNSILVEINGMALLAEPSRQGLERIWQYEGQFEEFDSSETKSQNSGSGSDKSTSSTNGLVDPPGTPIREPVSMTFILHGDLYSVLLLSNPPYGIEWSPCGNFALVKRAYAFGASAGVKRGSLVAAVNNKTLRELDHNSAATELRKSFVANKGFEVQFCFTPTAARTGHFERQNAQTSSLPHRNSSRHRPKIAAQHDGVEVRVHPLLWNSRNKLSPVVVTDSVAQLAYRVAAGELYTPAIRLKSTSQRIYRSCPPLGPLMEHWDAMDALEFCVRYHRACYDEQALDIPSPLESTMTREERFQRLCEMDDAADFMETFLLQFLCLGTCHRTCGDEKPEPPSHDSEYDLIPSLMQVAMSNSDLAYRMELVVQAFEYQTLTTCLKAMRVFHDENEQKLSHKAEDRRCTTSTRKAIPTLATELATEPSIASNSLSEPIIVGLATRGDDSYLTTSTEPTAASLTMVPSIKSRRTQGLLRFFRKKKKSLSKRLYQSSKKSAKTLPSTLRRSKTSSSIRTRSDVAKLRPISNGTPTVPSQETPNPVPTAILVTPEPSTESTVEEAFETSRIESLPPDEVLFSNTADFLNTLEKVCLDLEGSSLRSFSKKVAEWALQPWSASKGTALAQFTLEMRQRLTQVVLNGPLWNPLDSSELLTSLDMKECYILPSAHFPFLLTFNCQKRHQGDEHWSMQPPPRIREGIEKTQIEMRDDKCQTSSTAVFGEEKLYRTQVQIQCLKGSYTDFDATAKAKRSFVVHGAVSGVVVGSGKSSFNRDGSHSWDEGKTLTFESRSSWGAPQTLSLRVSESNAGEKRKEPTSHQANDSKRQSYREVGFSWIDLAPIWERLKSSQGESTTICVKLRSLAASDHFDEHGDLPEDFDSALEQMELQVRIDTKVLELSDMQSGIRPRKRSLLYKHDDDLRQEMFAILFVKSCDSILKACGLDLKLLTFGCIPVGKRRGFVEWLPGSVPLSEICQPFAGSILGPKKDPTSNTSAACPDPLLSLAKAGLTKYESLHRVEACDSSKVGNRGSLSNNPIQDYLRSMAYHPEHPFMIRKDVMETYVKSCAGYSVITYLLGVGDRHLDNLLLHQRGHFFHCDYSFILGNDPKKFLPMRITNDMVHGMGGRESDNFALFLSLTCAAFLTLRKPENVRHLLSLVRIMEDASLPDISENQSAESAVLGVRERLRLDLSPEKAISFMEKLIEDSLSSRMWIAVDAIHSLGKRF